MNSTDLILLGAFDALIALIQSERDTLGRTFQPEAAVQTLSKVRSELANQLLTALRAEVHASELLRTTLEQLLEGVPQGSDLEAVLRGLHHNVVKYLPQGPTPPWPSLSSSSSILGLGATAEIGHLMEGLRRLAQPGREAGG